MIQMNIQVLSDKQTSRSVLANHCYTGNVCDQKAKLLWVVSGHHCGKIGTCLLNKRQPRPVPNQNGSRQGHFLSHQRESSMSRIID